MTQNNTTQTLTEYLTAQKSEIADLMKHNMFHSARLVLDNTIGEYELRLSRGEC